MKMNPAMDLEARSTLASIVMRYAAALLAVAACTLVGVLIESRWGSGPVVLLYIPPVLAAAIYCRLCPALVASVASALAYNYFFTQPYHSFVIHSPADIVTVAVLFFVAVATSQLVGMLRVQAWLAASHAARNATIASFARRLLACQGEQEIAAVTVEELSHLFDCNVVLLQGQGAPCLIASAPGSAFLAPSDLAAAALTLASGEPTGRGLQKAEIVDWQFRPISSEHTILAAVGIARADGLPVLAESELALFSNLLDQAALALERARLEGEAREVSALRERDKLRSALLASIGEDVKPRLNAIGTVARALRRDGSSDKVLAANIAAEVAKLDRYVDGLVDLGPGDEQEPIVVGDLTIDLHRRSVSKSGETVHLTPKEYAVLAELAKHAGRVLSHSHLLRAIWGPAHEKQIDYLRVAIRALRLKLEENPANPALILTQPAVGYRLAVMPAD